MPLEIERKYLVDHKKWNALDKPEGKFYRQGYLSTDENKTIRIRVTDAEAYLTIKGKSTGATRQEFEYEIPLTEAEQMLNSLSESELSKTRYRIHYKEKLWEVDVFHDANDGLIVAEIELKSEDEQFELPDWVLQEVTDEAKYYNSNLTLNPFKNWK
ncbi:CYTH domain-containing protein [Pinibacter aurantiacus]|uniref:CYTH domain-containing protein n=1 Tax=Pinibacter aurantiacus TaxID=2851599 RepID=A0A9E2SF84_9BACT|nr:CYTH domain-containing protein [Pinibacter aurantiacus]MBV4360592.1 CYTH domain-containing protein [Pinibacter aurantiacus]